MQENLAETGAVGATSPEYLTTDEVAARLRVPPATLRYWRMKGEGPCSIKVGPKHVRYRASDVDNYLAAAHAQAANV